VEVVLELCIYCGEVGTAREGKRWAVEEEEKEERVAVARG
jgi:hypothetical protein